MSTTHTHRPRAQHPWPGGRPAPYSGESAVPTERRPLSSLTRDGHLEAGCLETSYPTLLSSPEMSSSSKQAACNLGLHELQRGRGGGRWLGKHFRVLPGPRARVRGQTGLLRGHSATCEDGVAGLYHGVTPTSNPQDPRVTSGSGSRHEAPLLLADAARTGGERVQPRVPGQYPPALIGRARLQV